jgi:hypothetical protein
MSAGTPVEPKGCTAAGMPKLPNDARRPGLHRPPVCGFTLDDKSCRKRGDHPAPSAPTPPESPPTRFWRGGTGRCGTPSAQAWAPARRQTLMVAATTAGSDPSGFAAAMHAEMVRIDDDGSRAPHVFVFLRNTPEGADPFDEANWAYANPALDDFLSREAMRADALEARNNPSAENSFLQFRLNRWVRQASRWIPMHLDEASSGEVWPTPDWGREKLAARVAWCGFDLAAKLDLTAWCLCPILLSPHSGLLVDR